MKRIILFLSLLYIILTQFSTVFANPENIEVVEDTVLAYKDEDGNIVPPVLLCEGAVLINADSGEILYEKNLNKKMYPASTTKVMTAILALENSSLDETVLFSAETINSIDFLTSSTIGMLTNETLTMEEALNGLIISSANEVATAIAVHIAGSEEQFAKMMTEKAKELGAMNTNFVNAHGLHDDNHYTTPYDLAVIFKYALNLPYFKELISALYYQIPETEFYQKPRDLVARNKLILKNSDFYYQWSGGGKTGFTTPAGNTLVSYAQKNGLNLIAAVMFDPPNGTYKDSIALYEYGFNFFKAVQIFDKYTFRKDIPVVQYFDEEEIDRGSVAALAASDITKTLREDYWNTTFKIRDNLKDKLTAPISEGEVLGKIEVYADSGEYGETEITALMDVTALTDDEIKAIKHEQFVEDFKRKLPIYLTFVPIILVVSYLLAVNIIKYKKRRKDKHFFRGGKKYRMR